MNNKDSDKEILLDFWEEVAKKIEADYHLGAPNNWTISDRKYFLKTIMPEIIAKKPHDYSAPNPGVSEATLRRIFNTKESLGTTLTKDIFAWLLGHPSYLEYRLKSIESKKSKIKKKPNYKKLGLILLFIISIFSIFLFFKNTQNEATIKEEALLKSLIIEGNNFEFSLAKDLDKLINASKEADTYFTTNGSARGSAINYLNGNKKKNYILSAPDSISRQKTLEISVSDKKENSATLETVEYWNQQWKNATSGEIEYVYERTNRQTYLLVKTENGKWKIQENKYRSDTEEDLSLCEVKTYKDKIKLHLKGKKNIIAPLFNNEAIGQAILLSKCICNEIENDTLSSHFTEIGHQYELLKMKLNKKKINSEEYLSQKNKLKIAIRNKLTSIAMYF